MAFLDKVTPYSILGDGTNAYIDLTTARSLSAQGSVWLSDGKELNAWVANSLLVNALTAGSTLSIGVGDGTDTLGMMTAATGLKISGIPFTEVFFTNAAQPGKTAEILIAWID